MTDSIAAFFHHVDRRDWAAIRAGMAGTVETDYSSLFGGVAETLTAEELIGRWQGLLPGFDATQHLLGPIVSTGPDTFECNVRGYHHLGGRTWMAAGWYRLTVRDGRIAGIVLNTLYEEGDRGLVTEASGLAEGAA